jgi:hypothetical protein
MRRRLGTTLIACETFYTALFQLLFLWLENVVTEVTASKNINGTSRVAVLGAMRNTAGT